MLTAAGVSREYPLPAHPKGALLNLETMEAIGEHQIHGLISWIEDDVLCDIACHPAESSYSGGYEGMHMISSNTQAGCVV